MKRTETPRREPPPPQNYDGKADCDGWVIVDDDEDGDNDDELENQSVGTKASDGEDQRERFDGGQQQVAPSPPPQVTVHDVDWGNAYVVCPRWQVMWKITHTNTKEIEWPSGVQIHHRRIFVEKNGDTIMFARCVGEGTPRFHGACWF